MHVQSLLIQLISGVNLWPVGSLTFLFRERALCAILIHFCGCRKEACSSRYRGPLRRIFPSFLPCDAIMQAWALNAPLPFILSRMKLHPNPTPHPRRSRESICEDSLFFRPSPPMIALKPVANPRDANRCRWDSML